jgi:hypothetical protein
MNENATWAVGVLDAIRALRNASEPENAHCLRELLSLLRSSEIADALDKELEMRRLRPAALEDDELVRRELVLAGTFGFSEREATRYVRMARKATKTGEQLPEIASTAQLIQQIERLGTPSGISAQGIFARGRNRRKIRQAAEGRLFAVGTVIANTVRRNLFDLSYCLAVLILSEVET